jgi:hypothetical protein
MITFFLIVGLLISIGLNISLYILAQRLLNKLSTYEKWILDFREDLTETLALMREIDKQGVFATNLNSEGAFEHDDQVGQIFKDLVDLVEKLNERIQ